MFKKLTRKQLEQFLARHTTEKRTLDIGAGGSSYNRFFPNRYTIDIDPARKPDLVADAHQLPFADDEYESILCTEVLEHMKNPTQAISEMWRVLQPGGTLILTTRFVYPLHDTPHDYWRFTKYGLQELFKNWELVELVEETTNFSTLAVLYQRLAYQGSFRFDRIIKFLLFLRAAWLNKMNGLIKCTFGDIKKSHTEDGILASGYYLVAKKP